MLPCWRCSNKGLWCCCDHAVRSRPALSSWYLSALGTQPQPNVSRLCIWFSADHRSSRAPLECQWPVECWVGAELLTPADKQTEGVSVAAEWTLCKRDTEDPMSRWHSGEKGDIRHGGFLSFFVLLCMCEILLDVLHIVLEKQQAGWSEEKTSWLIHSFKDQKLP